MIQAQTQLYAYLLAYPTLQQVKIDAEQLRYYSGCMNLKWSCFWLSEAMQVCALILTVGRIHLPLNASININGVQHLPLISKLSITQFNYHHSKVRSKAMYQENLNKVKKQIRMQELNEEDDPAPSYHIPDEDDLESPLKDVTPEQVEEEETNDQEGTYSQEQEMELQVSQGSDFLEVEEEEPTGEEEGDEEEEAPEDNRVSDSVATRASNSHEPLLLFLMQISPDVKKMFYLNDSLTISHVEALIGGTLTPIHMYDIAFWHIANLDPQVTFILTDPGTMRDILDGQTDRVVQVLKAESDRYRSHRFVFIPLYKDNYHSLLLLNRKEKTLVHYDIMNIGIKILEDLGMPLLKMFNQLEEVLTFKKGVYYNQIEFAKCPSINYRESALATLMNMEILVQNPQAFNINLRYSELELIRMKLKLVDKILNSYLDDKNNQAVLLNLVENRQKIN